jgi:hypothetical protein
MLPFTRSPSHLVLELRKLLLQTLDRSRLGNELSKQKADHAGSGAVPHRLRLGERMQATKHGPAEAEDDGSRESVPSYRPGECPQIVGGMEMAEIARYGMLQGKGRKSLLARHGRDRILPESGGDPRGPLLLGARAG